MKLTIAAALVGGLFTIGLAGCSDTAKTQQETTISTPGGTTKITTEKTIKSTGENPPVPVK